jgi:hypothetical protein
MHQHIHTYIYYRFNSVSINPYAQDAQGTVRFVLEIIVLAMILVNICMELFEFAQACMEFRALEYVVDLFNFIDWLHFIFLILTVSHWGYFWQLSSQFDIPESFSILHDVTTEARPFLTDAEQEHAFLVFLDRLGAISDVFAMYAIYSGISVLLFVLRILKSLDFQERMGLVTRTIEVCPWSEF